MGTTTDKTTYLNNTKLKIKDGINRLGGELTNLSTFRSYAQALDDIYDKLPKVTGTGSDLSLAPTLKGGLNIIPIGNAEQDTTAYVDVGTWEQGIIDSSGGNIASNYWVRTASYIPVKSNVLYNISRTIATEYMAFWFYDNTKTFVGTNETSGLITTNLSGKQNRMRSGDTSIEVTINNTNVAYMRMADASNDLSTIYTISTQAPTPDYPQDVKVVTGDNQVVVSNANLFNKTTMAFVRGVIQENETISRTNPYVATSGKISLRKGTYTFYNSVVTGTNWRFYIQCFQNGTRIYQTPVGSNAKGHTFTLEENYDVHFQLNGPFGVDVYVDNYLTDLTNNAFLLVGEITTEPNYIEHQEQSYTLHLGDIKLNGIGNYIDLPFKDGDTWKIARPIYKRTFNGNENWNSWYNVGSCIGFYCSDNTLVRPSNENTYNYLLLSDKFSEAETRLEIVNGLAEKNKTMWW